MSEFDKQESDFIQFLRRLPFDDAPRPEHGAALREQVLRKFDQAIAAKTAGRPWKHTFDSWRELMRRPVPRLVAVTIVCLSITAPWLLFPGRQSTAFAFDNFATVLVEAKTARFQMEITIEGQPKQKVKAYYLAPGRFRQEMAFLGAGSVSISDDIAGKMVMLMPAMKTAMVTTSKGKPKDQPPNDPFFRLRELLTKSRDMKDNPFKPIGEKEINGKQVTGFRSDSAFGQCTIWGDPKTGHPVRVEAVWSVTPRNETVMSDFEIDVDLKESMFDLTPPADYKVQSFEVDLSKPGEPDLVEAFKACGNLSGGEFPDSVGLLGQLSFIVKHTKERFKNASNDQVQKITKEIMPIAHGFQFGLELPASADAHYAGKGVKQGTADKPIFWYKPEGSTKYRVIHADLTVKDADAAPQVPGADRLNKASRTAQPN
jgi:outer membrane lipoprotein-sorting protein